MAGADHGLFLGGGVSGAGQAAELALRSAAARTWAIVEAAGVEKVAYQLPAWIEHYNREAPHSALGMQAPAEFYAEWRVKNKTQPVQK